MLALSHETDLTEQAWNALASRAELPCTWQEYVSGAGASRTRDSSRRQYCRVGLRSIAIVWLDEEVHAGYTKDVSRSGLGFYCPVQLFPKSHVRLWLPGHSVMNLRIRRCKRLKEQCFECGGIFTTGGLSVRIGS